MYIAYTRGLLKVKNKTTTKMISIENKIYTLEINGITYKNSEILRRLYFYKCVEQYRIKINE